MPVAANSMSFKEVPCTARGFRAGAIERLGAEVKALAGRNIPVLLVADAGLKPFGIVGRAVAALEAAGSSVSTYAEISGEPKEAQVEAARQLGSRPGRKRSSASAAARRSMRGSWRPLCLEQMHRSRISGWLQNRCRKSPCRSFACRRPPAPARR